jgi:hypothetical protein
MPVLKLDHSVRALRLYGRFYVDSHTQKCWPPTAGAAVAGVRRARVAAGVRSVAAEAEVRAAETVRPRIGSSVGGMPPSSSNTDESPPRLRLARRFGDVVEEVKKSTQLHLSTTQVLNGSVAAFFSDSKFL